jgi:hypothetical protein
MWTRARGVRRRRMRGGRRGADATPACAGCPHNEQPRETGQRERRGVFPFCQGCSPSPKCDRRPNVGEPTPQRGGPCRADRGRSPVPGERPRSGSRRGSAGPGALAPGSWRARGAIALESHGPLAASRGGHPLHPLLRRARGDRGCRLLRGPGRPVAREHVGNLAHDLRHAACRGRRWARRGRGRSPGRIRDRDRRRWLSGRRRRQRARQGGRGGRGNRWNSRTGGSHDFFHRSPWQRGGRGGNAKSRSAHDDAHDGGENSAQRALRPREQFNDANDERHAFNLYPIFGHLC